MLAHFLCRLFGNGSLHNAVRKPRACLIEPLETRSLLSATIVNFPDANLEAAVRAALAQPLGDITSDGMLSLTTFTASNQSISSLSGLEYATHLTYLDVSQNQISDLTPLAGLSALQTLQAYSNQISDLSPLVSLTNLGSLYIGSNPITSVAPLASMPNLTTFRAGYSQISDLSPLASLHQLDELDLGANNISDISPLAGMTQLVFLGLNINHVADLSPLTNLTNLRTLSINNNLFTDLTPILGMTKLNSLDVSGDQIGDLGFASAFPNLTSLYAGDNTIDDLTPLQSHTNLTQLNLSANRISDLTPLSGMSLTWLYLSSDWLSDISPLASMTSLRWLYVDDNDLDLTPLSPAQTVLDALQAAGANITLTPQSPAPSLTISDDSGNPADLAVDFGQTTVGTTTAPLSFAVGDPAAGQAFVYHLSVTGPNAADFAVTPTDNFYLSTGDSMSLHVRYHPSASGPESASITFKSNAPGQHAVTLQATGLGVVQPTLSVTDDSGTPTDNSVVLPVTAVGATSTPATFTLANGGDLPLHITSFAVAGADPSQFVVTARDAGGVVIAGTAFDIPGRTSYTVAAQLHPSSIGAKFASITFNTNDSAHAGVTFQVAGAGILLQPARSASLVLLGTHWTRLAMTNSTVSFGKAKLGKTAPVRTLRITNGGTQALSLKQVAVSQGFQLLKTAPRTVAPGSFVTIQVRMLTGSAGARSGILRIKTDDPDHPLFNVRLTGTVLR